MTGFLGDVRIALRNLRRQPGTSMTVVLTVAVGIAAAASVFAVIDALMLRPLPGVERQRELINVHATAADGTSFHAVSYLAYRALAAGNRSLSGLAGYTSRLVSLAASGGEPRLAIAQIVTGNYFALLGARPGRGRFFGPAEDAAPGRDAVAVVSDAAWKTRFGADPTLPGRSILINGRPFTVVGVTEPDFVGTFLGQPFDVWTPLSMIEQLAPEERLEARDGELLEMTARLAPGATRATASAEFATLAGRLRRDGLAPRGSGFDLQPTTGFEDSLRGPAVKFFAILGALAALVLGVAGSNVTSILLARGSARARELGVRMALGARRGLLVRLLMTETLLLFLAGGAAGIGLTFWATPALERFELPTPVPIAFDFHPGPRLFLFVLVIGTATGLLFGILPALSATGRRSTAALHGSRATEPRAASRLRSGFVAFQIGVSALLLITAGLFLRTVRRAAEADPGFDAGGLTMTTVDPSLLGYDGPRALALMDRLVDRAATLPGVTAASATSLVPLGLFHPQTEVRLPETPDARNALAVDFSLVADGYFRTMGVPLRRGRAFATADRPNTAPVVIVNETLAKALWPGADPIGRAVVVKNKSATVVGVARDGKYRRLGEAPRPFVYLPIRQHAARRRFTLLVRGGGSASAVAAPLRREIRMLEPALPPPAVLPVREYVALSTLPQRAGGVIAGALGILASSLSAIGLAGLVAFSVSRRTREIGVRLALGARPANVVQLEMERGLRAAALGLAGGAAAAVLLARLLSGFLFGLGPADSAVFAAAGLLLGATALAATYFPARRAARVDPMTALRAE